MTAPGRTDAQGAGHRLRPCRPRAWLALAALVTVALGALLGGSLREPRTEAAAAVPAAGVAAADVLQSGLGATGTASLVRGLEDEVAKTPRAERLVLLGLAYQQRARETADPAFYRLSERALRRALVATPRDARAIGGLGSLALARHRFREALTLGRRARVLAPYSAHPYGVVGDALIELGRYDEAFRTFDRMASLRPGLAAYARISYARELLGDLDGAVAAMRLAVDAAQGAGEPAAWARTQLAKLHFGRGQLGPAARQYRLALEAFPGYVFALEGLAHVEVARGRPAAAIALARRAADAVPLPQFAATLGDLYARNGRTAAAKEQYSLVGAIERLLRANGVRTDLETAVFDLDHGIRLRDALTRARAARAERPSILGDDALGWALARNGRCQAALPLAKRSLRLGTRDATLYFHRGYAERCAGNVAESKRWLRRALDLNPHFSLVWAPLARRWAA